MRAGSEGGAGGERVVSLRVGFRAPIAYREILMRRGEVTAGAGSGPRTGLGPGPEPGSGPGLGLGLGYGLGLGSEGYPLYDAFGLLSPLNYEDCEEATMLGVEIVEPPAPPSPPPIVEIPGNPLSYYPLYTTFPHANNTLPQPSSSSSTSPLPFHHPLPSDDFERVDSTDPPPLTLTPPPHSPPPFFLPPLPPHSPLTPPPPPLPPFPSDDPERVESTDPTPFEGKERDPGDHLSPHKHTQTSPRPPPSEPAPGEDTTNKPRILSIYPQYIATLPDISNVYPHKYILANAP